VYNILIVILYEGFMTADERKLFDHLKSPHLKYWVPFIWFGNLATKARNEGRIRDSVDLQSLMTVSVHGHEKRVLARAQEGAGCNRTDQKVFSVLQGARKPS
jgi:hypothetical protein